MLVVMCDMENREKGKHELTNKILPKLEKTIITHTRNNGFL